MNTLGEQRNTGLGSDTEIISPGAMTANREVQEGRIAAFELQAYH
jgi:hypothetical protein